MKRIIQSSEVLGTVEERGGTCEVCASADAAFDEAKGTLIVHTEAFLRPAAYLARERHLSAEWLPPGETVREQLPLDDCREVAREIFHRWIRKVRDAAPRLHAT